MTSNDFDVIIVGSGPAGVSSAFPLLAAGLSVLMIDGGRQAGMDPPKGNFLNERNSSLDQWKWMVGTDFHALTRKDAVSPKLRVPTMKHVFDGFHSENKIDSSEFIAVGTMAEGGLSNAWGCGVATFSREELSSYPFAQAALEPSYKAISERMGISGVNDDDLSDFFGQLESVQPALPLDDLQKRLYSSYHKRRGNLLRLGLRLGRARVAALSQPMNGREPCDLSGMCLWGCHRKALYSATYDLEQLKRFSRFTYASGLIADRVEGAQDHAVVYGHDRTRAHCIRARRVILAAGTLASTRLALGALEMYEPVNMQACPTGAFLLWLPRALGSGRSDAFGLGQLSFSFDTPKGTSGFGSLFNVGGIPVAEFVRFMPLFKRFGIDLASSLLNSCIVGNVFLPGDFSTASLKLQSDGTLKVEGGYREDLLGEMKASAKLLRSAFLKMGAILLPGSFTVGKPGSDIHYAASLPMRARPERGQTGSDGALHGAENIIVADGASLSSLPAKSHTLTIMANADRIGRLLSERLSHSG
ncbi:MAG: FAD-dependent monooxygenase [Allorhizobium sp.]